MATCTHFARPRHGVLTTTSAPDAGSPCMACPAPAAGHASLGGEAHPPPEPPTMSLSCCGNKEAVTLKGSGVLVVVNR
jgi:hypothetical protein